jgi:hypothetical protein
VLVLLFLIPFLYNMGVAVYYKWAPASYPDFDVQFVGCKTDFHADSGRTRPYQARVSVPLATCIQCNNNSDVVPLHDVAESFLELKETTLLISMIYNILGGIAFTLVYLLNEGHAALFTRLLAYGIYVKPMELSPANVCSCCCCDKKPIRAAWCTWRVMHLICLPALTLVLGAINFATQFLSTAWALNVVVTKRTNNCPIPSESALFVVLADKYNLTPSGWDIVQLFPTSVCGYAPHLRNLMTQWSDPYSKLAFTETVESEIGRKLDAHLRYQLDPLLSERGVERVVKRLRKTEHYNPTCLEDWSAIPPFVKKKCFGYDKKEKYVVDVLKECRELASGDPELFDYWRSGNGGAVRPSPPPAVTEMGVEL